MNLTKVCLVGLHLKRCLICEPLASLSGMHALITAWKIPFISQATQKISMARFWSLTCEEARHVERYSDACKFFVKRNLCNAMVVVTHQDL